MSGGQSHGTTAQPGVQRCWLVGESRRYRSFEESCCLVFISEGMSQARARGVPGAAVMGSCTTPALLRPTGASRIQPAFTCRFICSRYHTLPTIPRTASPSLASRPPPPGQPPSRISPPHCHPLYLIFPALIRSIGDSNACTHNTPVAALHTSYSLAACRACRCSNGWGWVLVRTQPMLLQHLPRTHNHHQAHPLRLPSPTTPRLPQRDGTTRGSGWRT